MDFFKAVMLLLNNKKCNGAPCRTRTCNILLRRQVLYPVELRALIGIDYIIDKREYTQGFMTFSVRFYAHPMPKARQI